MPHEWNKNRGPVVPHENFPTDCKLCHEQGSWHKLRKDFRFDHAAETGVPLFGAHLDAQCLRCHNDRGPVEVFSKRGCVGCHVDSHRGQLGTNCQDCHSQTDWSPRGQIEQHNRTQFPLIGVHAGVACRRCHLGADAGNFLRAPTACADCHQEDLARAQNPDHVNQGWVSGCQRCHQPIDWHLASFDHSRFPLTGAHASAACLSCHQNNVFAGTPSDCFACHSTDYQGTTQPNHGSAGFNTDCKSCHGTVDWSSSSFNHNRFPLTGAHTAVACATCHVNNVYQGLSQDCFACHADDYQGTTQPNHATSGYNTDCKSCHGTADWSSSSFNHNRFPLTGAHTAVACATCHVNNVYQGLSQDCFSCHADNYQGTTQPNHAAAGFNTDCKSCHGTVDWSSSSFNHNRFPLTGAHTAVACATCHVNNVYQGLSQDCFACHADDYQRAANPNHAAAGYPTTCINCHNTTTWNDGSFNHTFNITGGPHRQFNCTECHRVPNNVLIVSCTHCHSHRQSEADNEHQDVNGYTWSSPACISCHPTGR